jgi:hypothetical protein
VLAEPCARRARQAGAPTSAGEVCDSPFSYRTSRCARCVALGAREEVRRPTHRRRRPVTATTLRSRRGCPGPPSSSWSGCCLPGLSCSSFIPVGRQRDLLGDPGQGDTHACGPHRDDVLHPADGRRGLSASARCRGHAARVSRIALVPFVVFYCAWEALQGVANGVLVTEVNGLPATERADRGRPGPALRREPSRSRSRRFRDSRESRAHTGTDSGWDCPPPPCRRPAAVAALLGVSGFLITAHPPPYGPIGLGLFIVAVLLFVRSRSAVPSAAPLAQPRPA